MSDSKIVSVRAQQVYTKRGHPGIEAIVKTADGSEGRGMCTSGISIGTHEVKFTFDGGEKWKGKGVMGAVKNVNEIIGPAIIGLDASKQAEIDHSLINIVPNAKGELGGNAIAAVSAAVLKAGAKSLGIPLYRHIGGANAMYLPVPGVGLFMGDKRYGGGVTTPYPKPTNSILCYDFETFADASYAAWEIYELWQEEMQKLYYDATKSDHDFFVVPRGVVKSDEELWEICAKVIQDAGYEGRAGIQMDVAADTYFDREEKLYRGLFSSKKMTKEELMKYYQKIVKNYPIVCIEDPFNEDDYDAHAELTSLVDIQIVGDDLFTTMKERVAHGASMGAANCVLLKVNQVGTITEALEMIQLAYKYGYGIMPCESRGEGVDIADYCVGINAGSVREQAIGEIGNRFLEIEQELGHSGKFIGKMGLKGKRFQTF